MAKLPSQRQPGVTQPGGGGFCMQTHRRSGRAKKETLWIGRAHVALSVHVCDICIMIPNPLSSSVLSITFCLTGEAWAKRDIYWGVKTLAEGLNDVFTI